jgi:hypothetical protein
MITIDKEGKILYMKSEPEDYDDIKKRSQEEFYEFPLISGYICPECNRVIMAYYVGAHPYVESNKNPFMEKTKHYNGHYHSGDLGCKEGTCHGGSYFRLENHEHQCKYKIYSTRGISNSLNTIYKSQSHKEQPIEFTTERLLRLVERILNGEVPGMTIIEDVCGVDEPLLAIDQSEIGVYKGSHWTDEKAVEYMIKYSGPELPVDEPEEEETEIETKSSIETVDEPITTEVKTESPTESINEPVTTESNETVNEEAVKFAEHLGKDVDACRTVIFGGGTTLKFTDGTEALVYPGKDFVIAGKIQDIFGKMDTVPFNETNCTALNNILAEA